MQRSAYAGGAPPLGATAAALRYFSRVTDFRRETLQLGPKPAEGAYMGIAVLVGQISVA